MSNMGILRGRERVTLRCQNKKKSGVAACNSPNPELTTLMTRFMERFEGRFLTEETQRTIRETIAEKGIPYLAKQDARKGKLQDRLREIEDQIKNIQDTVRKDGTKYPDAKRSLMENLDALVKERRGIKEGIDKINDNDKELEQYITDPDGVMEKLLEMKTYTMPQDPQLVRQLIELYVDRIEIYRKHGVIYYHMGTCEGDQPAMETIYLDDEGQAKCDSQQPRDPQDAVCCPLGGSTGIDRGLDTCLQGDGRFPRPRGDRPVFDGVWERTGVVPPPTRG